MSADTRASTFFVAGGNLHPKSESYVKRPADDELFNQVLAGEFCYILTAPQMGKSSLMVRTISRLQEQGVRTAIVYLAGLDSNASVEQWYQGLFLRLKFQLKLSVDLDTWWWERVAISPTQRFTDFLREVVLEEIKEPVVIFIDEVEAMLNLNFAPEFLAAIRFSANARPTEATYQRLTFVLLGVAIPTDLVKDDRQSPFNIGQKINLAEFIWEEAQVLQQGLTAVYPEQGEAIFARIFHWTNGHPYLTQKLCLAAVKEDGHWPEDQVEEEVDRLVEELFLLPASHKEANLQRVQDSLENNPRRNRLSSLYRQVCQGKKVSVDEQSLDQERLRTIGLVRVEQGILQVRNEIYRRAFDLDRIKAKKSVNWMPYVVIILTLFFLVLAGAIGFYLYQQRQHMLAAEAQVFIDSFKSTTDPTERLTSLAGLFDLSGYSDQARQLFYEELSSTEQLALFDLADPQTKGAELLTVVKGVYTAPNIENKAEGNALLEAMAQPLLKLNEPLSLEAISLEIEIRQWLKGRDYYAQGAYQQAVSTYNIALSLNDRNPGLYFDQGLAYAALDNTDQALNNFEIVSGLDKRWQKQVQQAVANDAPLYVALWHKQRTYQALAALVNTPTPRPTVTPLSTAIVVTAATPTLSPTPTPVVIIPTTSPTPALPTATPLPSPTWAPTPAPIRLAYVVTEGEYHTLFLADLVNLTVTDSESLVPRRASSPTWSPDGQRIAFLGEVGIEYELPGAPGGGGIWIYDLKTKAPTLLREVSQVRYVAWSPEGSLIAYESTKDTGEARIFFMDLAGVDRPGNIRGEQPVWSPDGSRIIIRACRPECGLWLVDLDGRNLQQITFDSSDSFPHWWGNQVVFASQRGGNWDIYRLSMDETGQLQGQVKQLTTDPSHDTTPIHTPDGQYIFFRSSRDGQWAIWVMNVDGTNQRHLLQTDGSDAWNREKISIAGNAR